MAIFNQDQTGADERITSAITLLVSDPTRDLTTEFAERRTARFLVLSTMGQEILIRNGAVNEITATTAGDNQKKLAFDFMNQPLIVNDQLADGLAYILPTLMPQSTDEERDTVKDAIVNFAQNVGADEEGFVNTVENEKLSAFQCLSMASTEELTNGSKFEKTSLYILAVGVLKTVPEDDEGAAMRNYITDALASNNVTTLGDMVYGYLSKVSEGVDDESTTVTTDTDNGKQGPFLSAARIMLRIAERMRPDENVPAITRISEAKYDNVMLMLFSDRAAPKLITMADDSNDEVYKLIGHLYYAATDNQVDRMRLPTPSSIDTIVQRIKSSKPVGSTPLHEEVLMMNELLPCGVNMTLWQIISNTSMSGFVSKLYERGNIASLETVGVILSIVSGHDN
jgi:hypothetical protein